MPDSDIFQLSADASQALAECDRIAEAFQKQAGAGLVLVSAYQKINNFSGELETVIKAVQNGFQVLYGTVAQGSNVFNVARIEMDNTARKAVELEKQLNNVSEAEKRFAAVFLKSPEVAPVLKPPVGLKPEQDLIPLQAAIEKLKRSLASIGQGISPENFAEFFRTGTSGAAVFTDEIRSRLNPAIQSVKDELNKLGPIAEANLEQERLAAQQAREAEQARLTTLINIRKLEEEFPSRISDPSTVSLKEFVNFEVAIKRVRSAIDESGVSTIRFNEILRSTFRREHISGLTDEEEKLLVKIKQLEEAYTNLRKTEFDLAEKERNTAIKQEEALRRKTIEEKKAAEIELRNQQEIITKKQLQAQLDTEFARRRTELAGAPQKAIETFGGVPSTASASQINTVVSSVGRLKEVINETGITSKEFQLALENVANKGLTPLEGRAGQAEKVLRQLQSNLESINNVGKGREGIAALTISFEGFIRLIEVFLLRRLIIQFISQIRQSVDEAVRFEQAISHLRTAALDSTETFETLSSHVRELAIQFNQPQVNVADAAYSVLASQLVKTSDATELLITSLKLSKATFSDVKDTVSVLTNALEAFGLSANQQKETANTLFEVARLGRVPLNELDNVLGRLGSLAHPLGISFQELSAAFVTLRQEGIRTSDSATLINAVLAELIKPSKEMQELLNTWGVATGEAAIATFGFSGVLSKLSEEIHKGTGNLGQLEQNIRVIRGTLGLGLDTSKFKKNFEDIKKGGDDIERSLKQIGEVPAERFTRQINEIKIELSKVGDILVKDIGGIIQFTGGGTKALETLFKTIEFGTVFFIEFKAVIALTNVEFLTATTVTEAYSLSLAALKTQTYSVAGAMGVLKTSVNAVLSSPFIFAAIAIATDILVDRIITADKRLIEEHRRIIEEDKKIDTDYLNFYKEQQEIKKNSYDLAIKGIREDLNIFAAHERQILLESQNGILEHAKEIVEASKALFKGYTDALTTELNETKNKITENENAIKSSAKNIDEIIRRTEESIFNRRLKLLSPQEQIGAINERVPEKLRQAIPLYRSGDVEKIEEARKIFDDIRSLEEKVIDLIIQEDKSRNKVNTRLLEAINADNERIRSAINGINRHRQAEDLRYNEAINHKNAENQIEEQKGKVPQEQLNRLRSEETLRHGREVSRISEEEKVIGLTDKQLSSSRLINNENIKQLQERAKYADLTDSIAKQEIAIALTTQLQIREELNAQEILKRQNDELKLQLQTQEANLKLIQERLKDLTEFSAFEPSGKLLEKFHGDLDNAKKELNQVFDDLFNRVKGKEPLIDFKTQAAHPELLLQGIELFQSKLKELNNRAALDQQAANTENLNNQLKLYSDQYKKLTDLQTSFKDSQLELTNKIKENLLQLGTFLNKNAELNTISGKKDEERFGFVRGVSRDIEKAITALDQFQNNKTPENLKIVSTFLNRIIEDVQNLKSVSQGIDFDKILAVSPEEIQGGRTANEQLKQLSDAISNLKSAGTGLESVGKKLVQLQIDLDQAQAKLDVAKQNFPEAFKDVANSTGITATNIKTIGDEVTAALTPIKEMAGLFITIRDASKEIRVPTGNIASGSVQGKAQGGLISGPKGIDVIPTMLTAGEFVINADSTRKFYSQLVAINNGIGLSSGKGYNSGGLVTNVGDISISVNHEGNSSTESLVREIGHKLVREIRRGTIKFNG